MRGPPGARTLLAGLRVRSITIHARDPRAESRRIERSGFHLPLVFKTRRPPLAGTLHCGAGGIRTHDLCFPKAARCQAALQPVGRDGRIRTDDRGPQPRALPSCATSRCPLPNRAKMRQTPAVHPHLSAPPMTTDGQESHTRRGSGDGPTRHRAHHPRPDGEGAPSSRTSPAASPTTRSTRLSVASSRWPDRRSSCGRTPATKTSWSRSGSSPRRSRPWTRPARIELYPRQDSNLPPPTS